MKYIFRTTSRVDLTYTEEVEVGNGTPEEIEAAQVLYEQRVKETRELNISVRFVNDGHTVRAVLDESGQTVRFEHYPWGSD